VAGHQWNDQDKCEKCGDRDWYASAECHVPDEAKLKQCACTGCTNQATHTWSGHPTCDDCGTPNRVKRSIPIILK